MRVFFDVLYIFMLVRILLICFRLYRVVDISMGFIIFDNAFGTCSEYRNTGASAFGEYVCVYILVMFLLMSLNVCFCEEIVVCDLFVVCGNLGSVVESINAFVFA